MPNAQSPLPEWLAWLETLTPNEIELGLERVQAVLATLNLPRPQQVLLIGGTNGKGSSVAMAEALLTGAGYQVGAYSSPHMRHYNERIRVNAAEASDADIVAAMQVVNDARSGIPLTYFEFGTLAALVVFARANVDVWLLEVGLGGRLDATNAVDPDASLITNVSLDHCDWLGNDIETIAREKAGIMRSGKPTVFAGHPVPATIKRHADDIGAELVLPALEDLPELAMAGDFQRRNATGVIALLNAAGLTAATSVGVVERILPTVTLSGRQQIVQAGGREWLLDVAHNPAAAAALATVLQPGRRIGAAIVGMLDDKDSDGVVESLLPYVERWIAVAADSQRAVPAMELARRIANLSESGCFTAESFDAAIEFARRATAEDDRILVTGSFYTVGPLLERLEHLGE